MLTSSVQKAFFILSLTCVWTFAYGRSNPVRKAINPRYDPGICNNKRRGNLVVVKDRNGEDKLVVCLKKGLKFRWIMLNEYSRGNYSRGDVVDNVPAAKNGVDWIKTEQGPKKIKDETNTINTQLGEINQLERDAVKNVESESCKCILQLNRNAKNGPYKIRNNNGGSNKVYCQMTSLPGCIGGGWTMVMKVDGRKGTFKYSSSYWSNKRSYNLAGGVTGFDEQETKLPTYWSTSFKKMCIGMKVGCDLRFVSIDYPESSLYSVIEGGIYRKTHLGRKKWKSLIHNSSLQRNCNREGFNVKTSYLNVRIGILGNQENDCYSPDSFVGLGSHVYHVPNRCGYRISPNTAGNMASCSPDNGNKDIKAMAYILVR